MIAAVPTVTTAILEQTLDQAVEIIRPNFHLGWDLFLALIPLGISLLLFRRSNHITPLLWWPLLGAMVIFLPNAPYVLTDVIHFVSKIRVNPPLPIWAVSILLLEYFIYFLIGMQSFTLSLILLGRSLKRHHLRWLILPIELTILGLCAFAMYLGRFDRMNSWDVFSIPKKVLDQSLRELMDRSSEEITLIFFLSVMVVFYCLKFGNRFIVKLLQHHTPHTVDHGGPIH